MMKKIVFCLVLSSFCMGFSPEDKGKVEDLMNKFHDQEYAVLKYDQGLTAAALESIGLGRVVLLNDTFKLPDKPELRCIESLDGKLFPCFFAESLEDAIETLDAMAQKAVVFGPSEKASPIKWVTDPTTEGFVEESCHELTSSWRYNKST